MEEKKNITGAVVYKNLVAQQHEDAFNVFKTFLNEIRPSQILEIGTAGGGFTLFLRDYLNEIGLSESKIRSYDINHIEYYNSIINQNVDIRIENIFDNSHMKIKDDCLINEFIEQIGVTLVLVDGGYKIGEFKALSGLLKVGDFIMAHDYSSDLDYFNEYINQKIWNWCEITDSYIEESCNIHNLEKYKPEEFQQVVWTCRKKIK
jgi:cephalosporin hydroxylase